jgi:hypothetical protein
MREVADLTPHMDGYCIKNILRHLGFFPNKARGMIKRSSGRSFYFISALVLDSFGFVIYFVFCSVVCLFHV